MVDESWFERNEALILGGGDVERIRVKNAYSHVWWMSPSAYPWAHNRRILTPYSEAMRGLLEKGTYNYGERHSEHVIGEESFLKDNGGAIPSNVIEFTNTRSHDTYLDFCRTHRYKVHPARMAMNVAVFFIKFPSHLIAEKCTGDESHFQRGFPLQRTLSVLEFDFHRVLATTSR